MVIVAKGKGERKYKPFNIAKNKQVAYLTEATHIEGKDQIDNFKQQLDHMAAQDPDTIFRIVTERNTNTVIFKTGAAKKKIGTKSKKTIPQVSRFKKFLFI